jgi:digalactosyldiacylglycerol synthase
MGKFAIIPVHESNKFFLKFPNCLGKPESSIRHLIAMYTSFSLDLTGYRNKWEFAANLRWALTHEPEPLTDELANEFTWEAATDRLIQSAAITRREAQQRALLGTAKLDERIAFFHHELGKGARGDRLRKFLGGGPIANQVRYEMIKQGLIQVDSESEGIAKSSSFVQAIRSSLIGNSQAKTQLSS